MDLLGNLANLKVDTVLSAVDKYVPGAQQKIKNAVDKAKAYVNNVSELELRVLEATNHEPWGPHGSVMQEITSSCFNSEGFHQVMGILDQRLSESPENWRLVYKSLLLLEYMAKHGPLAVADALVSYSRLAHLERLRDRFEFKEPSGRDQGVNVRQRAGALVALVTDREKLNDERDKAAKNRAKYTGVSSSSMRYGGFGGGASSSRDYDGGGYGGSGGSSSGFGGGASSGFGAGAGGAGSSYQRSASAGAGAGSGRDSGGGGAAAAADPVEATRQRIARLKAEGALADGGGGDGVGPGLDSPPPDGLSPKKPKKLSEIRINPAISATFAKPGGGLAPPPGAGGAGAAPRPAAPADALDLLGDLDGPAPAAPAAAAAASGAAGGGGGDDDWAAFEQAPAAGSAAAPTAKPVVDINALLGPLPTTSPAASAGKAPLPLGDFCSAAPLAPAPAPARPAPAGGGGGADPFGPFVAPSGGGGGGGGGSADPFAAPPAAGAAAGDPFAASSTVHMAPQAAKHAAAAAAAGPKLGPDTAKAKDPFADLAFM